VLLDFLPGKGRIFHNRTGQEDHPGRQGREPGPAIPRLFALKAWQRPAQGGFAEVQSRFNRPAAVVCAPDGLYGDGQSSRELLALPSYAAL